MKNLFDFLFTSWIAVVTHKLRSFLTILGVVIGVGAVIALMSIGKGTEASMLSRLQALGANTFFIQPGFTTQGGVRGGFGSATTLTMEDAQAIAKDMPYLKAVAPYYSTQLQIIAGSQNMNSRVMGVTPEYQTAYNLQTTSGSFMSGYEYDQAMRVAVLGPNVKATLFGDYDPVGQTIRVGSIQMSVIGVLLSKGASMGSTDDAILVPLTTLQQMVSQPRTRTGGHVVNGIAIAGTDETQATFIKEELTSVLRTRHQLSATADNDFSVTSMEEVSATISDAMQSMTLLLGAIAAISLLVGGIGVMNIMLVSVIERTREIGIRKALGAKERSIWGQFVIEATFLTLLGGVIGVGIGYGASYMLNRSGILPTVVSPDIVVLAVSVAIGIGLFFGFYPAWQASRLNPIEALRAE